jgi:single-strand DNA-binding protein
MALNRIVLFGRLTKDPEHKQLSSGASVCKFTVACDRGFVNKQTNERESDFIECQAWRGAADFAARWFHKGDAITVEGSLRNNNWTDNEGKKHYSYIVNAENIGFGGKSNSSEQTQTEPAQPGLPENVQNAIEQFEAVVSDQDVPF